MRDASMRKLWFTAHQWIGLGLGLLLSLQGLTGSLNVFYREIDHWSNPSRWEVSGAGPALALNDLVQAGAAQCDRGQSDTVQVELPESPDLALAVFCGIDGVEHITTVDPNTADVLASWPEQAMATHVIYELHSTLLLDEAGDIILVTLSISLLALALSGIYLWWPRGRWSIRSFVIRKGARGRQFWFEFHRVVGLYASPLLALLGFTGLYLVVPSFVGTSVAAVAPVNSLAGYEEPSIVGTNAGVRIDASRALAIVEDGYPEARVSEVFLPVDAARPILVVFRQPKEWIRHGGESVAWLHPETGEIVRAFDSASDAGSGDRFLASLFPLHAGQVFGLVHRWLLFFAGLAPTILLVTGFVLWLGRRSAKAKTAK